MKKTYAVIGLGRFGEVTATRLSELGNEVLAIDLSSETIQRIESKVTCAVVADAREESVLRSLGVRNYDCAIVSIGTNLAASVIITMTLKELGVKTVICKATDELQRKALEKVGADRVILPEQESAMKLAQTLNGSGILDFISLSTEFSIAEIELPKLWIGKSLRQLNIRAKTGLNVLATKIDSRINPAPNADEALQEGTVLVMLGRNEQLTKIKG